MYSSHLYNVHLCYRTLHRTTEPQVLHHMVKNECQAVAHFDLVSSPDSGGGNGLCLVNLGGEGLHGQAPVPVHGPLRHGLLAEAAGQGSKAGHLGHTRPGLQGHHTALPMTCLDASCTPAHTPWWVSRQGCTACSCVSR